MKPRSPELQAAIEQVGEPKEVFKCLNIMLTLGALGGLLLIVAGVAVPVVILYFGVTEGFRAGMLQAIPVPFAAWLGWSIFRSCSRRLGSRVHLCERGFIYEHRQGVTVFPWAEIVRVGYDDITATPGKSGFPRVAKQTGFSVQRADGVDFPFSLYSVSRHLKLARAIFDATYPLGAKWY